MDISIAVNLLAQAAQRFMIEITLFMTVLITTISTTTGIVIGGYSEAAAVKASVLADPVPEPPLAVGCTHEQEETNEVQYPLLE